MVRPTRHEQLSVRVPINVQLDTLALGDIGQEGSEGLVLRRRTGRATAVRIGARVGRRTLTIPLVRPVTVEVSAVASGAAVGLGVFAPHAVAILRAKEAYSTLHVKSDHTAEEVDERLL